MALVIRLRKLGSRGKPFFRIAVAEAASARDGPFIEEVGWYDPKQPGDNAKLNEERVRHWLAQGAKPSETVRSILKKHKLLGTSPQPAAPTAPVAEPAEPATEPTEPTTEPTEPATEPRE